MVAPLMIESFPRAILHVDGDASFTSVEQEPDLLPLRMEFMMLRSEDSKSESPWHGRQHHAKPNVMAAI